MRWPWCSETRWLLQKGKGSGVCKGEQNDDLSLLWACLTWMFLPVLQTCPVPGCAGGSERAGQFPWPSPPMLLGWLILAGNQRPWGWTKFMVCALEHSSFSSRETSYHQDLKNENSGPASPPLPVVSFVVGVLKKDWRVAVFGSIQVPSEPPLPNSLFRKLSKLRKSWRNN